MVHTTIPDLKKESTLIMAGKKAFITGGSIGTGRGIAQVLTECGYDIAVTYDANPADAESLKIEIEAAGRRFYSYQASLDKPEVPEAVTAKALEDLGGIDLLVCCAAQPVSKSVLDTDIETLDYYYRLNFRSYLLCAKVAAARMIDDKTRGSIIFVTTTEGLRAYKEDLIYGSFAAALHRSTESMAMQLAPHGIRLNCIAPGITDTKGDRPEKETPSPYKYKIPAGRRAVPSDIGYAVEFLASEKADYITGTTIKIDGGLILPGMPESNSPESGYGWNKDAARPVDS